jgi:formyl-CoA transferase
MGSKGMAGDLYDKEWDDVYLRGANVTLVQKTHIDALFQAFVANYTRDELMKEAQARDIQVVKMHDVKDIMNDPHLKERECFVTIDYPELNDTITINGSPFKSKEMTWSYYRRAPFIGEHNKEIYMNELGLSAAKMAILKEGGII